MPKKTAIDRLSIDQGATRTFNVAGAPPFDPPRARMAVHMVSALFARGRIPPPGTDISDYTHRMQVVLSWEAQLNGPLAQMAGQSGFGWHQVSAAEIGGCTYIEELVALVNGKLVPRQMPLTSAGFGAAVTQMRDYLSFLHE